MMATLVPTPNVPNIPSLMSRFDLKSYATDDALAQAAAGAWLDEVELANRTGATYTVALSGGRIAKKFYSSIAAQAGVRKFNCASVHFFWADERCVPPTDAESNYRLAREFLFEPLAIPASNIHRILGEEPPDFAATEAEAEICRIAPLNADGLPALDLVILGLGEDGHVASLFPGASKNGIDSRHAYLAIADSPKPPSARVTLSYAAIASARQTWVLVSGQGKTGALRNSLNPTGSTPLARVLQSRKVTRLFTDIPFSEAHIT